MILSRFKTVRLNCCKKKKKEPCKNTMVEIPMISHSLYPMKNNRIFEKKNHVSRRKDCLMNNDYEEGLQYCDLVKSGLLLRFCFMGYRIYKDSYCRI